MLTRESQPVASAAPGQMGPERWGSQVYNEWVTDVAAIQKARQSVVEQLRNGAGARAAQAPEGALEDVEKFVSQHGPFRWYYSDLLDRMVSVSQCRCGCDADPADARTVDHYAEDGACRWLVDPS